MTLAWQIARIAAVLAVLAGVIALLPAASTYDTTPLTIPSQLWDPLVGVLQLNRYLPISELLILAGLTVAIQAGLAGFWMVSWVLRHVLGS